eukprot:TRINITY_DN10938_c0_g1_i1.p1 TRINITY_DN10938_c0_g1~~TRINITY_DN10938_c0_g1_i1.p1  ORF type:complete len:344 (+),score=42.72 TRINITY_DN10938_c0_g1_i1:34-1065(+)
MSKLDYESKIWEHIEKSYELIENEKEIDITNVSYIYGNIKDHKKEFDINNLETIKLRPIIGSTSNKYKGWQKKICKTITPYVIKENNRRNPKQIIVEDTRSFVKFDKIYKLGVKGDVTEMYSNIPTKSIENQISKILNTINHVLPQYMRFSKYDDIRPIDFGKRIKSNIYNNVVKWKNKYYKQTLGIKMGNVWSPLIAQLYIMEKIEECNLPDEPSALYVDDCRLTRKLFEKLKLVLLKDGLDLKEENGKIHLGLRKSYNDMWFYDIRETTIRWKHKDIWNETIGTTIGQIKNLCYFNKDDMFLRSKIWTLLHTMFQDKKLYFKTVSKIIHPRSSLNLAKLIK